MNSLCVVFLVAYTNNLHVLCVRIFHHVQPWRASRARSPVLRGTDITDFLHQRAFRVVTIALSVHRPTTDFASLSHCTNPPLFQGLNFSVTTTHFSRRLWVCETFMYGPCSIVYFFSLAISYFISPRYCNDILRRASYCILSLLLRDVVRDLVVV